VTVTRRTTLSLWPLLFYLANQQQRHSLLDEFRLTGRRLAVDPDGAWKNFEHSHRTAGQPPCSWWACQCLSTACGAWSRAARVAATSSRRSRPAWSRTTSSSLPTLEPGGPLHRDVESLVSSLHCQLELEVQPECQPAGTTLFCSRGHALCSCPTTATVTLRQIDK
jgi:hypothetical protein